MEILCLVWALSTMKKDGSFIRNSVGFSHLKIKRMEFGYGIRVRDGYGRRKAFGLFFQRSIRELALFHHDPKWEICLL